jgi:hypothetical protein
MKEIFEKIIKNRYWQDSTCGSGSTLEFTELLRESLPSFLARHNITSMLDLPCGDYSWMQLVNFPADFSYIGGDIVEFMIDKNRQSYPDVDFRYINLVEDELPKVDLLFTRDCLFHLAQDDVVKVLRNFVRSGIKYILTTSYLPQYSDNHNIITGDFRPIDLLAEPFNLPTPIDTLDDGILPDIERRLCLWSNKTIAEVVL